VAAIALMSLALGCVSIADMTYWTAGIDVAGDQVGVVGGILNTGANVSGALAPFLCSHWSVYPAQDRERAHARFTSKRGSVTRRLPPRRGIWRINR